MEEPAKLVCVWQSPSEEQQKYQQARLAAGAVLPSNIFYKDATPRVAHYLSCEIQLQGRDRFPGKPLPLELTLVYDDGTPTSEADQASLRILSLSSHVKAAIPADGDSVTVSYRIELGSFRRADRSFALKIHLSDNKAVESCITPAVYVLSKKKLDQQTRGTTTKRRHVDAFPQHDADDDSEDSHRHHLGSDQENILRRLYALETRVQELTNVIQSVLPHVQAMTHYPPPSTSAPFHQQDFPPEGPRQQPGSNNNDYDYRNAMAGH